MENVRLDEVEVLKASKDVYLVDALLGNWECVIGKNIKELSSPTNACYGRLAVDRALGCAYPEDEDKPDKFIIKFKAENLDNILKAHLQEKHKWCFGQIDEKYIIQRAIEMKLDRIQTICDLKKILKNIEWPSWVINPNTTIWKTLKARISHMKELLPFYKIEPKQSCQAEQFPFPGMDMVLFHKENSCTLLVETQSQEHSKVFGDLMLKKENGKNWRICLRPEFPFQSIYGIVI